MNFNKIFKHLNGFLPYAQLLFSVSIMFATWVLYIPQIIEKLNMNKGQLGLALFFSAIGSLIATPFGKILVDKAGEGKIAFFGTISFSIFIFSLFIAPHFYFLCLALFGLGLSSGIMQVGFNSLIATIERQNKIKIMSKSHSFWSIGGILASGFGTFLLILIGNRMIHILIPLSIVILLQIVFFKKYFFVKSEQVKNNNLRNDKNILKNGRVWVLALVGMCIMVSEGAIADWSGLFLRDVALTKGELLGLGYAGFSFSMAIGRLIGDYFSKKFGSWQIIFGGYITGILGFIVILSSHPLFSILGFIIVGLGFSIIIPEVYRMSSNIESIDPASGIAFMSGVGNVGFLAGPVVLGTVAENFGLTVSFIVLLSFVSVGSVLSYSLRSMSRVKYSLR